MTKSFSALVAILLVTSGSTASADILQDYQHYVERFGTDWVSEHYHGGPAPLAELVWHDIDSVLLAVPSPAQPETADVPDWVFTQIDAPERYIDFLRWSSTRPDTWGDETASYQVSIPGPGYVGLIPQIIPDGWVVTNRCLGWDDTYADDANPFGDCYVFELRPTLIGPVIVE
ncbi:hypothetical protein [Gymnodinialimonas hymeniacidonis]|uniref:hypothetical protein n=1 Tax=Gymnodinialimonas hymeniacidonis TaxID=3126508 RepID=UPI0034C6B660